MKALIIEDECTVVFLLKQLLKNAGIDTIQANTLREARIVLDEMQPDFIFMDNDLPDGLGFDIISGLHQNNPTVQVIAMTARDSFEGKEAAFKAGANYFLEKPFTIEQVYNSLIKEPQYQN